MENREKIDQENAECTFRPKINEVPSTVKNRAQGKKLGEYLYNVHKEVSDKITKKKEEEEQKLRKMSNKKFTREKSVVLLGKAEREKLTEIFNALDSDQDGKISASKIDITRIFCDFGAKFLKIELSLKLLDLFTPLLSEMEAKNEELNCEEFVNTAYEHYKTLNTYDKKAIFDFKRRFRGLEDIPKHTFTVFFM